MWKGEAKYLPDAADPALLLTALPLALACFPSVKVLEPVSRSRRVEVEASAHISSKMPFLRSGLSCRRAEINAWPQGILKACGASGLRYPCFHLLWLACGLLGCGWCFLENWVFQKVMQVGAWGDV